MFRYQTVIFDLDGTLLDTLKDLSNSVNYALKEYQCPERTMEEIRSFVGNGIGKLMERAVLNGLENPHYNDIYEAFTRDYKINCKQFTRPYEGIEKLLDELSAAGIQLGIVSNKADFAVKELNKFYFGKYQMIAIGEKQGINRKPAPDTVFTAMEQLKANNGSTVYVGDSDVDIQTAKNAGLPCISVSWGFRDKNFLKEHGGTNFAETPQELLELMMKI